MRPPESFIGQPIRSLQTMLRIIARDDPSYPILIPDGIYGPETMAAVSHFQRRHGLEVTGITDRDTWDAIHARHVDARIRTTEAEPLIIGLDNGQVIGFGSRHPHVYLLQGILQALSDAYESIPAPSHSGTLDEPTRDALSAFQQLNRLPMTGNLDKLTWKALALHYPQAAALREDSVKY